MGVLRLSARGDADETVVHEQEIDAGYQQDDAMQAERDRKTRRIGDSRR